MVESVNLVACLTMHKKAAAFLESIWTVRTFLVREFFVPVLILFSEFHIIPSFGGRKRYLTPPVQRAFISTK